MKEQSHFLLRSAFSMPRVAQGGQHTIEDVKVPGKAPRPPPISLSMMCAPTPPCAPPAPRGASSHVGGGVFSPRNRDIPGFARAVRTARGIDPELQEDLLDFLGAFDRYDQGVSDPSASSRCLVVERVDVPLSEARSRETSSPILATVADHSRVTPIVAGISATSAPIATAPCPIRAHGSRGMRCGSHRAYRSRQNRRLPKLSCDSGDVPAASINLIPQQTNTDKHATARDDGSDIACGRHTGSLLVSRNTGRSVSSRGRRKNKNRLIDVS